MNMFKGDRNDMFWHGVMYPCWLGQTKKVKKPPAFDSRVRASMRHCDLK